MESLESCIGLLLYCIDNQDGPPTKEIKGCRSPLVQSDIENNMLTLDKITGAGRVRDDNHLDTARYYIYYEITKNNINYNDMDASVDLYRRLQDDDAPADDDGNYILDTFESVN